MLPQWAGRKSGSAQSPAEQPWAPPRMPTEDAPSAGTGELEDEYIVLEPEEEPVTAPILEPEPDGTEAADGTADEVLQPITAPGPTQRSGRWLVLVAVVSVVAGLAAGYIYFLVTG